ncbi:glycyl-radical enzyme activating protein [Chloroflexota bacterium]
MNTGRVGAQREVESAMGQGEKSGIVFNVQKFSVHDGPGIRTTVFLKGCPLRCRWCANAESISPKVELGVIRSQCNNCGKCVEVCPEGVVSFDANSIIQFNREQCTACGKCVEACFPGALTIYGKQVTVEDVFEEVCRDKTFYEGSGGGVTVSGGEPLLQANFATALFQRCRESGIGTCLDTSGYAASGRLRKVLAFTDYVLYDIKHMDRELHRKFTGKPNDLILTNAKIVAASGIPMLCRIPLVRGVNDTAQNIEETARFVKTLRDDIAIELLPYHRLGAGKYETLDKSYLGEALDTPDPDHVESVKQTFGKLGVQCTVGG